jgi:hypothetical protein
MSGRLSDAEIGRRVRSLMHSESRRRDRGPVVIAVARFLVEHPGASANAVSRALPFARQDILWATRELRAAVGPVLEPENHPLGAGGAPTDVSEADHAGVTEDRP